MWSALSSYNLKLYVYQEDIAVTAPGAYAGLCHGKGEVPKTKFKIDSILQCRMLHANLVIICTYLGFHNSSRILSFGMCEAIHQLNRDINDYGQVKHLIWKPDVWYIIFTLDTINKAIIAPMHAIWLYMFIPQVSKQTWERVEGRWRRWQWRRRQFPLLQWVSVKHM